MQKCKIVDFFPFFGKLDKEKFELRYHILKDHVTKFVIAEANKSHSGIPVERQLRSIIDDLGFPLEKFVIIDVDIPDDIQAFVKDIDYINCYEGNGSNPNSVYARCRERIIKDSLIDVIDKFDDDTIFIHSDSDEIIDPKHIQWVANICKLHESTHIIKIPLVNLQGKANLRVHHVSDDSVQQWDKSMFFCTKQHLSVATPTNIRSNVNNPFTVSYVEIDGKRVEDMGWRFSWMGDLDHREIKRTHFAHYDDSLSGLIGNNYKNTDMLQCMQQTPEEGKTPPSGEKNCILRKYEQSLLPKEIYLNSRLINFFIGEKVDLTLSLKDKLVEYSTDTNDPIKMFDLAREYETLGQTATAVSFYLRSAEFSDDEVHSYECLLRIGVCFEKQKNRDYSVLGRFCHAAALCPTRPEAYYCLAKYHFVKNNWVDTLMFIKLCMAMDTVVNFVLPTFRNTWSHFEMKYISAVCLYEMGNIVESKCEFDELQTENPPIEILQKIDYFRKTHSYL